MTTGTIKSVAEQSGERRGERGAAESGDAYRVSISTDEGVDHDR